MDRLPMPACRSEAGVGRITLVRITDLSFEKNMNCPLLVVPMPNSSIHAPQAS